jgi:general secretion pathway protein I
MTRRPRERFGCPRALPAGFSLLEVLVAFTILALTVTALFRLFSGALTNVSAAEQASRAVLVAESVLAQAASGTLREGASSGTADEGRVSWTAQVTPYQPPGVDPELEKASEVVPQRLFRVTVNVAYPAASGAERTLVLSTVRLSPKELQP